MTKSKDDNCVVVNNAEELLSALEKVETNILIPKHFKEEFLKNTDLPLSETEQMGFELGFMGSANLLSSPLYHIINWLSKEDKQQKRIDSKLRKYSIKRMDEDLLLYLRQFDY